MVNEKKNGPNQLMKGSFLLIVQIMIPDKVKFYLPFLFINIRAV